MNKTTGIRRIINAARYSAQGLQQAFIHEAAFRQELAIAVVAVPAAFWLAEDQTQRMLMIAVVIWVLVIELLNSGIEAVVDRVGSEHHELAGRAKDLGSAAVFVSLLLAGYVWAEALFF